MAKRPDPYRGFRYRVEIYGLQQAGFQTVSGLERESKIEPFREGGVNNYEHQLVTLTTYRPLTLKRGLVDPMLWDWHHEVIEGEVQRRTITITLMDDGGNEVWHWICKNAFPSKWSGSELDATGNTIATESVEFVHHGLTRK